MLNEKSRQCLAALANTTAPDGEMCVGFLPIQEATGLDRQTVRRIVRALARKGFAEYWRGLWNDEGPAGAGYCITPAGRRRWARARRAQTKRIIDP